MGDHVILRSWCSAPQIFVEQMELRSSKVQRTGILHDAIYPQKQHEPYESRAKEVQMSLYVAACKVIYTKQTAFYRVSCKVIALRETPFNSVRLREIK